MMRLWQVLIAASIGGFGFGYTSTDLIMGAAFENHVVKNYPTNARHEFEITAYDAGCSTQHRPRFSEPNFGRDYMDCPFTLNGDYVTLVGDAYLNTADTMSKNQRICNALLGAATSLVSIATSVCCFFRKSPTDSKLADASEKLLDASQKISDKPVSPSAGHSI